MLVYALLPLFSLCSVAIPHFRALFSLAQPDEAQGEQMALIAALESLPQLYAGPLAALAFGVWIRTPWVVFACAITVLLAAILLLWVGVRARDHSHADQHHAAALLSNTSAVNEAPTVPVASTTALGPSD